MKHILKLARKLGSECSYPFSHYWGHFKGYWYIRFITILIVLVLILAVLVQIFKSTNWFAMWLFTFLSEWAMVLSASVMLMLAGAAIWAIMDNRYARIVDRNERLLNEIIKWAEDVARLNFKIFDFIEARISKESWVESSIGEIVSQFQVVEAKGVYINSIALSSFKRDKKLSKAIKAVNKELRKLVDISVERLNGKVNKEAVPEHMNMLRLKIAKLFRETAEIKTKI